MILTEIVKKICRICVLKFTERYTVEVKNSDELVCFGPKLGSVNFSARL